MMEVLFLGLHLWPEVSLDSRILCMVVSAQPLSAVTFLESC